MRSRAKVAVGLSGGIDSSFAAYSLAKENYEVIGITLKFYPQDNRCCDLESLYQASRLCHKLSIPHYIIDVEREFKKSVVKYFVDSYLGGLTPNPCAVCNQKIKFGLFPKKVKSFDIDYLATGHYAGTVKEKERLYLRRGKDEKKSQEYFLGLVEPDILGSLIFPLGKYTKEQVRVIAKKEGLMFAEREESQDVCFAKGRSYKDFIEENISDHNSYSGPIKHIKGKVLGTHKGIYYFTYGQREELGVSWHKPLYVFDINAQTKEVIVGEKEFVFKDRFIVGKTNWFYPRSNYDNLKVKVRYNSRFLPCRIENIGLDKVLCTLNGDREVPSPGQLAVFYDNDKVVAGGLIEKG